MAVKSGDQLVTGGHRHELACRGLRAVGQGQAAEQFRLQPAAIRSADPMLAVSGIGPEAAIALGGATSMDSTLPFLSRTYGGQATLRAIGVGFILSLAVPVMVPAAYWLLQKLSSG